MPLVGVDRRCSARRAARRRRARVHRARRRAQPADAEAGARLPDGGGDRRGSGPGGVDRRAQKSRSIRGPLFALDVDPGNRGERRPGTRQARIPQPPLLLAQHRRPAGHRSRPLPAAGSRALAGHWAIAPAPWPEQALETAEAAQVIRETVAALPQTQRAVITLRDMIGCTPEETCNTLGLTDTQPPCAPTPRPHEGPRRARSGVRHHGGYCVNEMDCKELVETITAYLDGTLPDADRRRFDTHLVELPVLHRVPRADAKDHRAARHARRDHALA